MLHALIISAATTATVVIYDAASTDTGPIWRVPSTSAASVQVLEVPIQNGIRITTTGTIECSVIYG